MQSSSADAAMRVRNSKTHIYFDGKTSPIDIIAHATVCPTKPQGAQTIDASDSKTVQELAFYLL